MHLCTIYTIFSIAPRLTLIVTIDQFAYHELSKHRSAFSKGMKYLLDHGIVYENAYIPYALPKTGPGHASLATGALPRDHGIVNNGWFDEKRQRFIRCEESPLNNTSSLLPSTYSAGNMITNTLSDQLITYSTDRSGFLVYALSQKIVPAIFMAGFLGKAFWLDDKTKTLTSSAAYFKEMPQWVREWIKHHPVPKQKNKEDNPIVYDRMIVDFATALMQRYQYHPKNMVLWISLSSMDIIGHAAGPTSSEITNCLQEIDHLIGILLQRAYEMVPSKNILMVLAADHGVMPKPELTKLPFARRINTRELKHSINELLKNKYGKPEVLALVDENAISLNHRHFDKLAQQMRSSITNDIKTILKNTPGIRQVWTFSELAQEHFDADDIRNLYKHQLYEGRTGDIIFYVEPYALVSKYNNGTSHQTPYEYDTHIPLILYKPGVLEKKKIYDKVFIQQVVPTLAPMLEVPKPASSIMPVLPGVF